MSVDCVSNDDKQEKMRAERGMLPQSRPWDLSIPLSHSVFIPLLDYCDIMWGDKDNKTQECMRTSWCNSMIQNRSRMQGRFGFGGIYSTACLGERAILFIQYLYSNGLNTNIEADKLWPSLPDRIGIWSVGFCGVRKTGEPGEIENQCHQCHEIIQRPVVQSTLK